MNKAVVQEGAKAVLRNHSAVLSNRPPEGQPIRIRVLAAPINPADLNRLQGSYPTDSSLGSVCGAEGVGAVIEGTARIPAGTPVIPAKSAMGWWRTELHCGDLDVIPIGDHRGAQDGMRFVNPPTAYRMLKDFVELSQGDWVIQNGANSVVGRAVIQLCRRWGIKTINVVRDRPQWDLLEMELRGLGADRVIKSDLLSSASGVPECKLALNCVGGVAAADLAARLVPKGTIVTYGGMSRKPVMLPVSQLVFRDIRAVGFWMSRWYDEASYEAKRAMIDDIGPLQMPPIAAYKLEQFEEAIAAAHQEMRPGKVAFVAE